MQVHVQNYSLSMSPAHLALLIELWIGANFVFPHGVTDPSVIRLALEDLISRGELQTLREFLVRSGLDKLDETCQALLRMAMALPASYDAAAFTRGHDPQASFEYVEGRCHPDALIVVFTGLTQRLGFPLPLVHGLFEATGCPVLYLKDKTRTAFCNGIGPDGRGALIARIRDKMQQSGLERTVIVGSSSGSFAALLCARELAASHVICLAGPTRIESGDTRPQVQQMRDLLVANGLALDALNTQGFDRKCQARYYFGADNPRDTAYGRHFAQSGAGDAVAVRGHANHVVLDVISTIGCIQSDLAAAAAGTNFPDASQHAELSQPFTGAS